MIMSNPDYHLSPPPHFPSYPSPCPPSYSVPSRQLETRLTFSFLPGLSWPGRETVHTTHHGGRTRATDAFTTAVSSSTAPTAITALATTSARRNLVGLVPPMDKSTEVAVSAAAAAASAVEGISSTSAAAAAAALGMESFGTGGAGSASAGQTSRGGRAALEDGNCSSTDDEGIARGAAGGHAGGARCLCRSHGGGGRSGNGRKLGVVWVLETVLVYIILLCCSITVKRTKHCRDMSVVFLRVVAL